MWKRYRSRKADARTEPPPPPIPSELPDNHVDRYWTTHVVHATGFATPEESCRYLDWRFDQYPLFREFSGLWGRHDDETIVDVGCGPGNDLTGFALHTSASRLIGIDVSATALALARQRLTLHDIPSVRYELIQGSNSSAELPVDDAAADYLQGIGVLMHAEDPGGMLREFRRVIKNDGRVTIMVYNRRSIWFHLYTAYERMVVENAFPGLTLDEAFQRNTDGPDCPISRAWDPEYVISLCEQTGFRASFTGGYLSKEELDSISRAWNRAIVDPRLSDEHREFLREVRFDHQGFPMYGRYHAGIGSVFHLKPI